MVDKTYNIKQELIAACNILDVSLEYVLLQIKLPSQDLSSAGISLTAKQVAKVFEILVYKYGKDDFHIKLADGFAKSAFGNAFLALQCSETLREGIYRVGRFKPLIEPVNWIITESKQKLQLTLKSISADFPLVGIGQIMSFLWLIKSCRNVCARQIEPSRVIITDEVPYQTEIAEDLGCMIEIGDTAYLELPAAVLDYAILSSNRYVTSGLDAGVTKIRIKTAHDDMLISAVYGLVMEMLPSGVVTLERTASKMAMSKRTLERRLSEQGYSFSEITRDCRINMARHYLLNTPLPVTEISLLLGYREVNSFHRAVKDWFGATAQEIRMNAKN